jgi:hypothetical protein
MDSIDAVRSYLFKFEGKGGKYFGCHYVEGNRILPYPKLLKSSVNVLAFHALHISQII